MISVKEIRDKIISGGLTDLLFSYKNTHPSELAQAFNTLPSDEAIKAFRELPVRRQLALFPYLDLQLQQLVIRRVAFNRAAYLLNNISSDDRASLVGSFKGIEQSEIIARLNEKQKAAVQDMLGYPKDSVARLINTDFATIRQNMTVAEATSYLQDHPDDSEGV